jgi:hypothetical protein
VGVFRCSTQVWEQDEETHPHQSAYGPTVSYTSRPRYKLSKPSRTGETSPQRTVTTPEVPSTSTRAPSGIFRVASVTETTQGMPSSRDTITA